ncbi:hypothetical protein AX17_006885 [Amanita inopinata Kibby_2008]|nr:hypothetical protein AX17_006885 [Amanita inopinata Kibby_2008]
MVNIGADCFCACPTLSLIPTATMLCRHACGRATTKIPRLLPRHAKQRLMSDLGLRSRLPPDSEPQFDADDLPNVSDQEWEIRTGRAIFVLQHTLPDFFNTGLITSVDTVTGTPGNPPSSSRIAGDALKLPSPASFDLHKPSLSLKKSTAHSPELESIYSPKIRLLYTPPIALPAPFPKTLHVEGLPLYIASSTFVRHTLKALYTDLEVELHKFVVQTPGSGHPPSGGSGNGGFFNRSDLGRGSMAAFAYPSDELGGPQLRLGQGQTYADGATNNGSDDVDGPKKKKKRMNREKSLLVVLKVRGMARVSGIAGEWDVSSTYMFSPLSGLILTHVINSIHPAPHQAVYDSLRSNLGKVFGRGLGGNEPTGVPGVPRTCSATAAAGGDREARKGGR